VPITNWTEHTAGNIPADRRIMGSTGSITFKPGDEVQLTYAFVFGRDYVNPGAQAGLTNMLNRVDSIQSYYTNGTLKACGFPVSSGKSISTHSNIEIYPNPTTNFIYIKKEGSLPIEITIIDVSGKIVQTKMSNQSTTQINLIALARGAYIISVKGQEEVLRKVIIKE
ncbi:MAG: T9SS type A sorting domain-containing protein, partial [Salibacteraceae bacterium]